jgi:hypothetical protein
MTLSRRVLLVVGVSLGVLAFAAVALFQVVESRRSTRATSAQLRAEVASLEQERDSLRTRRAELMVRDVRMKDMPDTPVRVGVPTGLARSLIEKVLIGFADRISVELRNIKASKTGTVKRVVTLGDFSLNINVDRATARLKPGAPTITFGGDAVAVALPVTVVSGAGRATVHFRWNSSNVGGALCEDMDVTQEVRGTVVEHTYPVDGRLLLTATGTRVMVTPRVPPVTIHVEIEPSDESWAAAQKVLDDKTGVCGFVLDRANVMGDVRTFIDRGFDVRVPLDRIKPVDFPVGVEPDIDVRGRKISLKVNVSRLSIAEPMIWLGVDVAVAPQTKRTRQ